MNTLSISIYLFKVIVVSGLLYSYYRLFLRDKPFHRFNRFFLLGIPFLSLTLPFIHLPFGADLWPADHNTPLLTGAVHTVTEFKWQETDAAPSHHRPGLPDWTTLAAITYILTTATLFYFFLRQLRYIQLLTKKYPFTRLGPIRIFSTSETNAPFSFLNRIFWNDQLDRNTPLGKQICPENTMCAYS